MKDAPKVGENTAEEIEAFVDKFVHGQLPDKEKDPILHALVSRLQRHSHTPSCQRHNVKLKFPKSLTVEERMESEKNQRCRFHIPFPEIAKTEQQIPDQLKEYLGEVEKVGIAKIHATKERMRRAGESEKDIAKEVGRQMDAIKDNKIHMLQSNAVKILLKRGKEDIFINNYNSTILRLWEANMDIQFVTNAYAAITYIAGYVAKAERSLAEEIKKLVADLPSNAPQMKKMRAKGNAFMKTREMSAQEAYHNCMGFPYIRKSRRCLFIPTGFPQERYRLLKSRAEREKLPPDSTEVFVENLIEKYERRACCERATRRADVPCGCRWSAEVKKMSLAVFASCYETPPKSSKRDDDEEEEDGEDTGETLQERLEEHEEDDDQEELFHRLPDYEEGRFVEEDDDRDEEYQDKEAMHKLPPIIYLHGRKWTLKRRTRRAVIRYHQFDELKDTERRYYSYLLLYKAFGVEKVDLNMALNGQHNSYKDWFAAEKKSIEEISAKFECFADLIAAAFKNIEEERDWEREKMLQELDKGVGWDGEEDSEDDGMQQFLDPDDLVMDFDVFDGVDEGPGAGGNWELPPVVGPAQYTSKAEMLAKLELLRSQLNDGQKAAHRVAMERASEYDRCQKAGIPYKGSPIFISGAGGRFQRYLFVHLYKMIRLRVRKELPVGRD